MRHIRRPSRPRDVPKRTIALVALPVVTVLCCPGPVLADTVSPTGAAPALPVVVSTLDQGAPCRPASDVQARTPPWTQDMLGLSSAWQLTRGAGVLVAVVDTGVGKDVPGLAGRVSAAGDAGVDCVGHGSFVAGLVAAAPQPDTGFTGVAPQARVLAVRGTDERGVATPDSVARGIRAAADGGASVITVSSALTTNSDALSAAVRHARGRDALVLAAAAPDRTPDGAGSSGPAAYWPAAEPGVLSVAAFGSGGAEGPVPVPQADLGAPGVGVVSVGPSGSGAFTGSGCSFAAGVVAGTAALVRSYRPGLTADQVSARLLGTAYAARVPRVDPYAAVSGAVPDTVSRTREAADPAVIRATRPDGAVATRGRWIAVGSALVVLALMMGAWVVPQGRARGWRAG
ncbi:S8 family serine peptidase [Streptomyces sp. NPDC005576]|uniref:S8 family serine peptidase n=1 Tax=unclassified Streptomyces TaxID=2593676 RepID=UPI0033E481CA